MKRTDLLRVFGAVLFLLPLIGFGFPHSCPLADSIKLADHTENGVVKLISSNQGGNAGGYFLKQGDEVTTGFMRRYDIVPPSDWAEAFWQGDSSTLIITTTIGLHLIQAWLTLSPPPADENIIPNTKNNGMIYCRYMNANNESIILSNFLETSATEKELKNDGWTKYFDDVTSRRWSCIVSANNQGCSW